MELKKKDFIEIEFTGKIKGGDTFDSNIKKDLEKAKIKGNPKPLIFCLGEGMFLEGIDSFLIGKEKGEYTIELSPEKAFGKRDAKLLQMIPMRIFHQHQINPIPGATFNFDGRLARIVTISGGRVMVDFNNPLAGKEVEYFVRILRKVDDKKEQVEALNDFFFRKNLDFEIKDKELILKVETPLKQLSEMFKEKYSEILGLDVKVEEKKEKKG
jgi:FKBP-type peptidyl-prolyl cis-trans isomerase 2